MERKWTFMVYMAGDNGKILGDGKQLMADLQTYGWRNLAAMASVGSTGQVAVVAQYDTLADQQGTPRFFMDGSTPTGRVVDEVPPVNTGDPKSLTDFILWAAGSYPAQRYALVLWNHGTGWSEDDIYARYRGKVERAIRGGESRAGNRGERILRGALFMGTVGEIVGIEDDEMRGICYDDSSMDFLDNRKLVDGLEGAEAEMGQGIALVGMDACLMSMVEVAYELRCHAEVMVGSQELEPGEGWPYGRILRKLVDNPEMSPSELGAQMVREYGDFYTEVTRGGDGGVALSAIDLPSMVGLGAGIGRLTRALTAQYDSDWGIERAVSRALKRVQRFRGDADYIDLCSFLQNVELEYSGNGDWKPMMAELRSSLERAGCGCPVIANWAGGHLRNAHGLSVYFPDQGCSKYYDRVQFAKIGWQELIGKQNRIQGS